LGSEHTDCFGSVLPSNSSTGDISGVLLNLLAPRKSLSLTDSYTEDELRQIESWTQLSQISNPILEAKFVDGSELKNASSLISQHSFLRELVTAVPRIVQDPSVCAKIKQMWQTLIFREHVEWDDDENATFDSMFRCLLGWTLPPGGDPAKYEPEKIVRYTKPLRRAIARASTGRRFFVTTKGNIGMAPLGAEENDLVCVIYGCAFPIFLRPKGEEFEVVGVGYFHRYGAGKAVREMEERILEEKNFVLI
jgi:hypothetical protein